MPAFTTGRTTMHRRFATKLRDIPRFASALLLLPILLLALTASRTPSLLLPTVDGGKIDPLRLEHEYTLLFFWTTDCEWSVGDLETLQADATCCTACPMPSRASPPMSTA